jgi:hypothetical protein
MSGKFIGLQKRKTRVIAMRLRGAALLFSMLTARDRELAFAALPKRFDQDFASRVPPRSSFLPM